VTYDSEISLHRDKEEIRIIPMPSGHTDGDSIVLFTKDHVASLGDLYFSGMYPIFHPEHGGSLEGYVKNLQWILTQIDDDTKIVPGHGPLSTKTELKKYVEMILASINAVRAEIKAGLTLDQIQQRGLDKKWEPYSHGYRNTNQWLSSIYNSLLPKKR
jgi:glyoxylase-like metal-dependent hydrolase (beta-lactamase superfamily II)